jgi:hypothetical protein
MLPATLGSGVRYIAWPDLGIVKGEGRLSALLDGDGTSYRLAARGELVDAEEAMREELRELVGFAPDGRPAEVSRFDLTTEREFPASCGRAVIRGLRSTVPPGRKAKVYELPDGTVESVAYVTARRGVVGFRAYDKGVESGSHPSGERVRFEAQNRARAGRRHSPETLSSIDLRSAFARSLTPVLQAAREVEVMHPETAVEKLAGRVARGDLSVARAENMLGSIALLQAFGRSFYDARGGQRRLKALRDAGVALDRELPPGAVLTLDAELREAMERFAGV